MLEAEKKAALMDASRWKQEATNACREIEIRDLEIEQLKQQLLAQVL